jgi:hypothetical protein
MTPSARCRHLPSAQRSQAAAGESCTNPMQCGLRYGMWAHAGQRGWWSPESTPADPADRASTTVAFAVAAQPSRRRERSRRMSSEDDVVDGPRFDGWMKRLAGKQRGRRDVVRAAVGGAFGLAFGGTAIDDAAAKKKCKKDFAICPAEPTKCCSKECCPPLAGAGDSLCRPKNSVCCSEATGGGSCSTDFPACCPIGPRQSEGICAPPGAECCSLASGGGWCPFGQGCCDDPDGTPSCCPAAGRVASRAAGRSPRRRHGAARR